MRFTRHIGFDYYGARMPESRIKGLQVYNELRLCE